MGDGGSHNNNGYIEFYLFIRPCCVPDIVASSVWAILETVLGGSILLHPSTSPSQIHRRPWHHWEVSVDHCFFWKHLRGILLKSYDILITSLLSTICFNAALKLIFLVSFLRRVELDEKSSTLESSKSRLGKIFIFLFIWLWEGHLASLHPMQEK